MLPSVPRPPSPPAELRRLLANAGLTSREADVYLTLLALHRGSVSAVARAAGQKRTGLYLLLTALERRGLVSRAGRGRAAEYVAEPPQALVDLFAHREHEAREFRRQAASLRPALASLSRSPVATPRVRVYQGRDRIEEVYAEIFAHPYIAIFNPDRMHRLFGTFARAALPGVPSTLRGRELVVPGRGCKPFAAANPETRAFRYKLLPRAFTFDVDIAVFDDTIIIFCDDDELTVVHTNSAQAAASLRSTFDVLWLLARPLRRRR
jgi:sugar-specific transcriptional regulator TrmB